MQTRRAAILMAGLAVLIPALAGTQTRLPLARAGRTDYVIVRGSSPTEAEDFAAEELTAYLGRVTGATFRAVGERDTLPDSKRIFVGRTSFARRHGVNCAVLGEEEWVVRSVGSDLIIAGGRPRGTLYGVYEFLGKPLGCHWLDESTEVVPTKSDLSLPPLELRGRPAFWSRSIYTAHGFDGELRARNERYLVRNRANAAEGNSGAKYGYCVGTGSPGGCHTFAAYADRFPADHPEYLSMDAAGQRIGAKDGSGPGGICLMHPEVRKLVLARLREFIATDRQRAKEAGVLPPRIYDISQNDNHWMCQCPDCKRVSEREGSQSGPVVDFINAIADGIRPEYPEIYVQTFAYSITETPPKTLKPRDNVLIRIAELNAEWGRQSDLFHPLTHRTNAPQLRRLRGWARITDNIAEWDYWIQYSPNDKFPTPYAPIACLPIDLRTFADNKVKTVFVECEDAERTSFFALKRWLGYQLMVNPRQPAEPLLSAFFSGYYGAAAPVMRQYLRLMQDGMVMSSVNQSGLENRDRPHLTLGFYLDCERLLEEAEARVAGDPQALLHVRRERIPVDGGLFAMWGQVAAAVPAERLPATREQLLARYEAYRLEQMAAFRSPESLERGKVELARELQQMQQLQAIEERRGEPPPQVRVPRLAADTAQGDPAAVSFEAGVVLAPWFTVLGGQTDQKLVARALHDGRYLYLELEHACDTAKLVSEQQVWSSDDWELFFAAHRRPPYRQLAIGPRGQAVGYDWAKLIGDCDPVDWTSGARIGSEVQPDRWTVRLSLPLATLIPGGVQPGGTFYANLCRAIPPPNKAFLTWSPNFDDSFHVPERLGEFRLD